MSSDVCLWTSNLRWYIHYGTIIEGKTQATKNWTEYRDKNWRAKRNENKNPAAFILACSLIESDIFLFGGKENRFVNWGEDVKLHALVDHIEIVYKLMKRLHCTEVITLLQPSLLIIRISRLMLHLNKFCNEATTESRKQEWFLTSILKEYFAEQLYHSIFFQIWEMQIARQLYQNYRL